ncbi:succinate dehydrogenase subunit 3-1, mitochondrial-like [Vicia villosa]|uniref:succinate dehydrogenase subunit 3-1, mitochondrial-like n=1 Tax=Vicia villosa TaxID=3911 RepID=UPI00273C0CE4|nr:succinate dehydrogenase subunit 3-1, mitochondrial-like [Vicia villosa]
MSYLLRSSKSKLLSSSSSLSRAFSSIPRSNNQIGSISPAATELFQRNSATLPNAEENPTKGYTPGFPQNPESKLGGDSNVINSLRYQALGLDTNVLAGARYGTQVYATKSPMLLGVSTLMARNFERSTAADTLGLVGQRRYVSDISSKTSEIKPPSGFRPLSPHLPLYQPQLSSTLSICNRIAGAFLAAVTLLFYMIYMKLGLVTLTYDSFYQFVFYSSKLHLLAVEISALAMSYHLYSTIRHLFL